MKKFLCMAAALICMIYTGASADGYLGIQGTFKGMKEGQSVSLEIYEQEEKSIVSSSMFPDYAVVYEGESFLSDYCGIFSAKPDTVNRSINSYEEILSDWLGIHPGNTVSGVFSGNLFENASTLTTYYFQLSDFAGYVQERMNADSGDGSPCAKLLYIWLKSILNTFEGSDPTICVRDYDGGKYRTILAKDSEGILMTISEVRSENADKHCLISYKENGLYCYKDYRMIIEEQNITITASFNTSLQSSYPLTEEPLICAVFKLNCPEGKDSAFNCSIEYGGIKEPMIISGEISLLSGMPQINASVYTGNDKNEMISFLMFTDTLNRPVAFTDKTLIHPDNKTENAEIKLAAYSGLMELVSTSFPVLPADYQEALMKLFFQ